MAEIKINPALEGEIVAFGNAGDAMNDSISNLSSNNISTLKTAVRFAAEFAAIEAAMALYMQLIKKDVADMIAMKDSVEQLDSEIAGSM